MQQKNTGMPVFEVRERNGEIRRIWANGMIEGFGEGAIVVNGFLPLLAKVRSETKCPSTADRQQ